MSAPDGLERLRVASWNLHGFIGEGRQPDPERSFRVVASLEADILALQEVDGRTHLRRLPDAFERVRAVLGGHLVEAHLFGAPGREYGHVLWSRHPIEQAEVHALPGPGLEPRAAIEAVVATPLGRLRVVVAHFGLDPRARPRQAAFVAGLVRPDMPTVALGDFNEWRRRGPVHAALSAALPVHEPVPTWPVRRPFAGLDRLYASRGVALHAVAARRDAAPASDHLPLVADLRF
ncbi:endonuclease [Aureimonas flava]|uniref:Endonuclease n=1 Tax=Aureimonas flava TaxID=2320271 RepID=A0A3A1WPG4_9HYPH|nr:endonuclease/exonuclease/phosphatase family protein [Aureimonas flava]RIY03290.1 endonuclease [Aureimonas flava]